jgi:RNA polymerase sigma factor (sigma-70 family)
MATRPLNSLVRHLRRAGLAQNDGESDGALLQRFVAHRDEGAFATLVRRYAPLVFGVCHRVLHHRQDAEDAFQATFLVLLRKAGSIRRPEVLGNWLYGVAYYTAKNASRMAARRRARERQVTEMAKAQSTADAEGFRELQSRLDEELSRLPEKYRVPVVLCELHGKSRKDVAIQLGCPEGTVSSRLARGRELLRQRLSKRGLALPAGSLVLFLARDPAAASIPPLLVAGTIKTALLLGMSQVPAAGVVSAQVASLTEGVMKTMLLAKLKIVAALVLAMSVITGAGLLARQALADKPAQPNAAPGLFPRKAAQPSAQDRTRPAVAEEAKVDLLPLTGSVLDPAGKPVAGARLYLQRPFQDRRPVQDQVAVTQLGTTGADGRFTLKLARADAQPGRPTTLIAAADGFGIDWVELPPKEARGEVVFRLVKDVPIRGRILSTEGKPIPGVAVDVVGIMVPGKLDELLKALQREWRAAETLMTKQLSLPLTKVLRVTASDKDGRFEVAGAGAGRLVGLELKDQSIAHTQLLVVTQGDLDIKAINQAMAQGRSRSGGLYGPSFEYIAVRNRNVSIEGTVREAGTRKTVAGATIQPAGIAGVSAVTSDTRGRYRILAPRQAEQYTLYVTPPANTSLIGRWMRLPKGPGSAESIQSDVELPRGVIITGRVFDKMTGKGVEASVSFVALPDNKFAHRAGDNLSLYSSTDNEGRFRLVTIPGPGVLVAQVHGTRETLHGVRLHPYPVNRYKTAELDDETRKRVQVNDIRLQFANACKVLDLKEGSDTASCDLVVDPGKTLRVNVEDPDGKPLAGAVASGVTVMPLGAITLKDADCVVYALDPEKPRQLILLHQERELAAVVTLRGDEKGPLSIRLQPTSVLTGRLLDHDGQPIRGAGVAALYAGQMGSDLARELRRRFELPRTDDNGRFRLTGIVPGLKFGLGFAKGRQRLKPETRLEIKPLLARQALDLGDIQMKSER